MACTYNQDFGEILTEECHENMPTNTNIFMSKMVIKQNSPTFMSIDAVKAIHTDAVTNKNDAQL